MQPQQPLGAPMPGTDPLTQSLMQQMAKAPPQTPGAVGSDLLAQALMQYGQGQKQQAQAAQTYGASGGAYSGPDPLGNPTGQQPNTQPGWLSPFMSLGMMG